MIKIHRQIYTLGIRCYALFLNLAFLFHPKAREWVRGRRNFFKGLPIVNSRKIYWFHCASLGEFDQGLPVMNQFKKENPDLFLLVTFFSPSGFMHYNKRKHCVDYACYLPIDTPSNASRFLEHFRPEKAFFVKYEFWANYIFEAKNRGIELYSISALFRPEHRFFTKSAQFFPTVLKQFDFFFVQNELSAKLLESIGIDRWMVTGDTRYDRVVENKNQLESNSKIEKFLDGEKAVILGSTWPADESVFYPLIQQQKLGSKIIIAPHSISAQHIQEISRSLNQDSFCYSEMDSILHPEKYSVLILDTIGHLSHAYNYGKIAYVGGGFSGNLHNILEPAVFGLPVIFGPKFSRFPEASLFIEKEIGFSVKDTDSFLKEFHKVLGQISEIKTRAEDFIYSNLGASKKIVAFVENKN